MSLGSDNYTLDKAFDRIEELEKFSQKCITVESKEEYKKFKKLLQRINTLEEYTKMYYENLIDITQDLSERISVLEEICIEISKKLINYLDQINKQK